MPVSIDPEHGGRWTSLVLGGREWLWRRPDPARDQVSPGSAFVDAGGLEECLPTVRGNPDHGEVWSRRWSGTSAQASVETEEARLERRVEERGDREVVVDYVLHAEPGYRFVWAAHALLDLSTRAHVEVPGASAVRVFPEAAEATGQAWPPGRPWVEERWPRPFGVAFDRFGPDDGTALGAVVTGCDTAVVHDGADTLRLQVEAPGLPTSVALWRNLGGFPTGAPYRSCGVEPMLGGVFDLADASTAGDAVTVPADGSVRWRLQVTSRVVQ